MTLANFAWFSRPSRAAGRPRERRAEVVTVRTFETKLEGGMCGKMHVSPVK